MNVSVPEAAASLPQSPATDSQPYEQAVGVATGIVVLSEDEQQEQEKRGLFGSARRRKAWLIGLCSVLVILGVVLTAVFVSKSDKNGTSNPSSVSTDYEERFVAFRTTLSSYSDPLAFFDADSPQSRALQWLVYEDETVGLDNHDKLVQRYAIMVIFHACGGEKWSGYVPPLNQRFAESECTFENFECDEAGNLVSLDLSFQEMVGRLPSEIALLSSLVHLNLEDNFLKGAIPDSLYRLDKLVTLRLGLNKFSSTISPDIGKLTRLETLYLSINALSGTLPDSMKMLTGLRKLNLADNALSGEIAPFIPAWTRLVHMDIYRTDFNGSIPTVS